MQILPSTPDVDTRALLSYLHVLSYQGKIRPAMLQSVLDESRTKTKNFPASLAPVHLSISWKYSISSPSETVSCNPYSLVYVFKLQGDDVKRRIIGSENSYISERQCR